MAKLSVLAFVALLVIAAASAFEFRVGGDEGWVKPGTGNASSESYNHWARRNRFHIGDSVFFKYVNDSVLVVNKESYNDCNATSPILEFADGNTTFRFDRYGFFYFISGSSDHCNAGQKLIIRVMVHPEHAYLAPGPAPFPEPSGGRDDSAAPAGASGASGAAAAAGSSVVAAGLAGFVYIVMMFV